MSVKERHRRERGARRQALLQAAASVFARHGLEGATIEMVAREAEVAVGTIYLYFSSRDDLFLSLTAERIGHLTERYREIQARNLDPLPELRTMTAAYTDYMSESRELFLTQQSVGWVQLRNRLRRPSEIEDYNRVMSLGHIGFKQWEASVRRVVEAGLIPDVTDVATTASVIWATLNGAFLLTGQEGFFGEVTGLSPANLVEQALEFHLKGAQPAANGNGHRANGANHGDSAARKPRAKIKRREKQHRDKSSSASAQA